MNFCVQRRGVDVLAIETLPQKIIVGEHLPALFNASMYKLS